MTMMLVECCCDSFKFIFLFAYLFIYYFISFVCLFMYLSGFETEPNTDHKRHALIAESNSSRCTGKRGMSKAQPNNQGPGTGEGWSQESDGLRYQEINPRGSVGEAV